MKRTRTTSTPEIDLSFDTVEPDGMRALGWIRGACAVGRAEPLFSDIISHVKAVLSSDQGQSRTIEIELEDVPTTVMPLLVEFFNMVEQKRAGGVDVKVLWFFPVASQNLRDIALHIEHKWPRLVTSAQRAITSP